MPDQMIVKSRLIDYVVSFIDDFPLYLKELSENRSFFIVDSGIYKIYDAQLLSTLSKDRMLVIEANEYNKTITKCQEIIDRLVEQKFRRNNKLVAIGGGVIQDITAFTASILYRGVEWNFFPTTLLAQADSCIGGKTSINLADKKNIIGSFYPPAEIFIDLNFLATLPEADILSGIGEMLHYYYNAASPLFEKTVAEQAQLLTDSKLLLPYIHESLRIKKQVIEIDEFDTGIRNKFNYGHTFGHALESLTDYAIKHGQAVTIGMDIANFISLKYGIMTNDEFERVHALLKNNFHSYDWGTINVDKYIQFLLKDKKNIGQNFVCILAKQPGVLEKHNIVIDDSFKIILRNYFNALLSQR